MASARAVVQDVNQALAAIAARNKRLNALCYVRPADQVRHEAAARVGSAGVLNGRTVAVKDNICTTEGRTACASRALEDYTSPYEATIVGQLRAAGAVLVGKTNMDEFAMGTNNMHSIYGPAVNPLFEAEHSAGGSSGGSAAAVAAGMCDLSIGTDTGGSVRLPAAYCGIVGFKPSYGLVSRWGVMPFAQSMDSVAFHARDVATARAALRALDAHDPRDPTSAGPAARARLAGALAAAEAARGRRPLRIGVPLEYAVGLSASVRAAWRAVLAALRARGHELYAVSLPTTAAALPAYYILAPAEAASNLARFDGVRYGFRAASDRAGEVLYGATRAGGFGVEVRRRILLGTYSLTAGLIDDHYFQAQKVRRKIKAEFDGVFALANALDATAGAADGVDVLVTPSTTSPAPSLAAVRAQTSPLDAYVNDVLTVPANLCGAPALNVPWPAAGGSVGVQVMGQWGDDARVLDVGDEIAACAACI
ncbi:amidase signature domain-containing protein [Dipodascopsis tothii]|uniref:amidase signature domain-containing protein n=1 Tax=Dipodascopsis tothii TaxID=44089 RepID=UPI0034CE2469